MRLPLLIVLLACPALALAQSPPAKTFPELEAARTAYQKALTEIRADYTRLVAPVNRTYAERLADLRQKLAADGSAAEVPAVQAEEERLRKGVETTPAEVQQMAGLLRILRTSFEKERTMACGAPIKREAEAHAAWASGLERFHAQLIQSRQTAKAAIVQAERDALARPRNLDLFPAAKPVPAPAPAPAPAFAPAPPGTKLDPALAARIKAAIDANNIILTDASGGKKGEQNIPEDGAVLLGFELSEFDWKGKSIKSLDPIFLTAEGIFRGELRGKHAPTTTVVQARDGFAVAGINVHAHDRISGFQLVFMKLDAASGKLDPATAYNSPWYGTEPTEWIQYGGDGRIVIGVHGAHGTEAETIGLAQAP